MAAREPIIDFSELDENKVLADLEEIRRFNPQRYEFEQLTAVIHKDPEKYICVGYKDITDQEFWCRGHMPVRPLMPGVMMCEAAAQLCSYFVLRYNLISHPGLIGFGGLEEVRFRGMVEPGCRLIIAAQLMKVRPRAMIVARFQEYVNRELVCDGILRGVPLPVDLFPPPPGLTDPTGA